MPSAMAANPVQSQAVAVGRALATFRRARVEPGEQGAANVNLLQKVTLTSFSLWMVLALAPQPAQAADAPSGLAVRDVSSNGASVTGWVVNETDHEVRDVRLMVEQQWRWTKELKPGEDNPGSGTVVRVEQPIPANGRVQFRYDLPAQPERGDGHFETVVRVLSFSEHWYEPTAAKPRAVVP
jgi:hypothetical protein